MYHTTRPVVTGRKGVVASGHHLATMAGMRMLAMGGNAVDAGVATGFALAVLKPYENSLGGECPILIRSPKTGKVVSISGQGAAPGRMTTEWFRENGIRLIPGDGLLGATVPGMFGAYATALKEFGTLTLGETLAPAIELAEEGFPADKRMAANLANDAKKFTEQWPTTGAVFLPGGKPPAARQTLRQPALANTLKTIASAEKSARGLGREGAIQAAIDDFYKGGAARMILEFTKNNAVPDASGKAHTGLLEMEDFLRHETILEEPISAGYRDMTIYKCGPWTQGPVFLQQLKLLQGFGLGRMGHNSAEYIHICAECAKLAFADRNRFYGDPRFVTVPFDRLLSDAYNDGQRALIDRNRANLAELDEPEEMAENIIYVGDTTHLDSIDRDGLMMSATPSGAWIPSSPVIPSLGFPLGTRAQVFNLNPGHPNSLAPGKRPRITLTPSIALRGGKPWLAFGTPGGDCQDQWALQFFLNVVEFGMDLQQAIDMPAFHTKHFRNSFYPKDIQIGSVFLEDGIGDEAADRLKAMGHDVRRLRCNDSCVCAVQINPETGAIEGAASSKLDGQGYAAGW